MAAPRPAVLVPLMPTVPELLMVLDESTVIVATSAALRTDATVAPGATLTVTPVLPACAVTVVSVPVQVTVVLLAGATLSQTALAWADTHSDAARINGLSGNGWGTAFADAAARIGLLILRS
ncbi:hypothetical protein LV28_25205 [Pandoraea pnomenusa]|nr:hypothetical protein LV28_25205 [Pandoraea pnomenusa]